MIYLRSAAARRTTFTAFSARTAASGTAERDMFCASGRRTPRRFPPWAISARGTPAPARCTGRTAACGRSFFRTGSSTTTINLRSRRKTAKRRSRPTPSRSTAKRAPARRASSTGWTATNGETAHGTKRRKAVRSTTPRSTSMRCIWAHGGGAATAAFTITARLPTSFRRMCPNWATTAWS